MRLLLLFATFAALFAADAPPAIAPERKIELLKLSLRFVQAQREMDRLQAEYTEKVKPLVDLCAKAGLDLSPDFDCVVKPAPPKAELKPPAK
jgi:hypothetical protein